MDASAVRTVAGGKLLHAEGATTEEAVVTLTSGRSECEGTLLSTSPATLDVVGGVTRAVNDDAALAGNTIIPPAATTLATVVAASGHRLASLLGDRVSPVAPCLLSERTQHASVRLWDARSRADRLKVRKDISSPNRVHRGIIFSPLANGGKMRRGVVEIASREKRESVCGLFWATLLRFHMNTTAVRYVYVYSLLFHMNTMCTAMGGVTKWCSSGGGPILTATTAAETWTTQRSGGVHPGAQRFSFDTDGTEECYYLTSPSSNAFMSEVVIRAPSRVISEGGEIVDHGSLHQRKGIHVTQVLT